MGPNSSTRINTRSTSAPRIVERRSSSRDRSTPTPRPTTRQWRIDDPEPETVGSLTPDQIGARIVIRSRDFLGTVYGTLIGVHPHPGFMHFTTVQLWKKKELTFRNDTEVLVLN